MQKTSLVFVLAGFLVFSLFAIGLVDFSWPWENVIEEQSEVGLDVEAGPARILEIEPIALDCRARVIAEVPVVGTQSTTVAGAAVSTDTIRMRAIGDIDTCVDAGGVEINERADGTIGVIIDADSIRFVRPRVDAIATMDSVQTDRGFLNQVVEAFPWTNEDDELTPAAFAFAQSVIGGSVCTRAAYDQTETALVDAYRQQMVEQGANADDIEVIISGSPDFEDNPFNASALGEFEFIELAGTSCATATP